MFLDIQKVYHYANTAAKQKKGLTLDHKMTKVYQILTHNYTDHGIFSTLPAAQAELRKLADERKYRLGVRHFKQSDNEFSFVLGWESVDVRFYIKEIEVK